MFHPQGGPHSYKWSLNPTYTWPWGPHLQPLQNHLPPSSILRFLMKIHHDIRRCSTDLKAFIKWMFPKIWVFTPQIIPCLIGFSTIIFTIHFGVCSTPIFGWKHPNSDPMDPNSYKLGPQKLVKSRGPITPQFLE